MITVMNDQYWRKEFLISDLNTLNTVVSMITANNNYFELTATGDCLLQILASFSGIPMPRHQYQKSFTWHGNMAKIILANL